MREWYSYKGKKYTGNNPPYYDLAGTDWYEQLKINLPQIRQEALAFLKMDGINIQEYFNRSMVEGTKWEAVPFMFWKLRNENSIGKGRNLFRYFEHIPNMVSLSLSILQPKTRIKGHHGDTDAIYRIHIPIYIPAGLPDCGFSVSGIARPWEENNILVFCDACFHEAWNMTGQPRFIMILDVIKEEFQHKTDNICANVLSSIKYQKVSERYKPIKKLPPWTKDMIRKALKYYPMKLM